MFYFGSSWGEGLGCSWLRLVVYRVFFGFLVFSVCVAIYFEYRGCEILCPNGGREKSPTVAENRRTLSPRRARRPRHRPSCLCKFPARPLSPRQARIIDDSTCTSTQHKQQAHMPRFNTFCYYFMCCDFVLLFDIGLKCYVLTLFNTIYRMY